MQKSKNKITVNVLVQDLHGGERTGDRAGKTGDGLGEEEERSSGQHHTCVRRHKEDRGVRKNGQHQSK